MKCAGRSQFRSWDGSAVGSDQKRDQEDPSAMAIAPQRSGIGIRRHFTTAGVHPYDEVRWERRDARITNYRDGKVAFEQLGVEVPEFWSLNATNILAQKYFRGTLNTGEREWSLRQVADRVADTLTAWGLKDGYFVDSEEAQIFNHELKHLIIHQKAAFNSPVWFNIGVPGVPQQGSACFILSVEDTMDSILNWYTEEGIIFKGGSGAGVNLSRIRSSHELLKGGGTASGPVSFMRGADASAGTIKSGGKTRRAAKMVILDVDHPDVEDFIWCKAIEERKARVLRDAGFDMDLDGADSHSTQYQNANNSVRVTDEFMEAVIEDRQWELLARTDGSVVRTVPARDLFRQIAHSAWECADPGLQYDTTINRWHTAPLAGKINGSNPCFPGSAKVHTDKGLIAFSELLARANAGESFGIYTHDATNPESPTEEMVITSPEAFMITGFNDIVRLRLDNGVELRCTPSHRIFTDQPRLRRGSAPHLPRRGQAARSGGPRAGGRPRDCRCPRIRPTTGPRAITPCPCASPTCGRTPSPTTWGGSSETARRRGRPWPPFTGAKRIDRRSSPFTPSCWTGSTASARSSSPSRPTVRPSSGWPAAPSRASSRPSVCVRSRAPTRACHGR